MCSFTSTYRNDLYSSAALFTHGSLRFQTLFLLDIRGGRNLTMTIDDGQIRDLFQLVNMDYLIDRYDLDTVCFIENL